MSLQYKKMKTKLHPLIALAATMKEQAIFF